MSVDLGRLQFEFDEVLSLYHGNFQPFQYEGVSASSWGAYGVQGNHRGFNVGVVYDQEHPYRPPRVGLSPRPSSRHYYDAGEGWHLCYCKPEEWSPRYTMATTLAIVLRFIDSYRQGKVD